MSVTFTPQYKKEGAVFGNAADAWADKNSLYTPELSASVDACYNQMLADGILLQPVYSTWDQATFTLTVNKVVSNADAYRAAVTFDEFATITQAENAGWTFLGTNIV